MYMKPSRSGNHVTAFAFIHIAMTTEPGQAARFEDRVTPSRPRLGAAGLL